MNDRFADFSCDRPARQLKIIPLAMDARWIVRRGRVHRRRERRRARPANQMRALTN
jgi:hypothetical protein